MGKRLIIGTRGSDLALYQANFIKNVLIQKHQTEVEIKIIKTSGDLIDSTPFSKMEGKGFFTKEIEEALLSKSIDLAIHSLKDLMTTQPDGLKLGAAGYRADRRELLLVQKDAFSVNGVLPVKPGSTIGTSSARRQCQIAFHNPELIIKDLRGNVPTRINKLRECKYDAILIAAAGINRLELDVSDLESVPLNPEQFLPAPAQGILGIQIRSDDPKVESIVSKLGSDDTLEEARLERGLLTKFDGGCSLPLGVYSSSDGDTRTLSAVLGIQENKRWTGLKRTCVSGNDIDRLLADAYNSLMQGELCSS